MYHDGTKAKLPLGWFSFETGLSGITENTGGEDAKYLTAVIIMNVVCARSH